MEKEITNDSMIEEKKIEEKETKETSEEQVRTATKSPEPDREAMTDRYISLKSEGIEFDKEAWILAHIKPEDIMEYLRMEDKKNEMVLKLKKEREERIFKILEMIVVLFSIICIVFFLKDNPTVLVNILYIIGIIAVLWILKRKDGSSE